MNPSKESDDDERAGEVGQVPLVPARSPANMIFWDLKKLVERVKGRGLAKENEEQGKAELLRAGPVKQVDLTQRR